VRRLTRGTGLAAAVAIALWFCPSPAALAQGGRGGSPATARASAPIDLTGYWAAVLTEDWHVRMFTAARGDFGSGPPGEVSQVVTGRLGVGANPARDGNIPYNLKGAQAAMAWDPDKDEAAGRQCLAYGAPGIMRQPTHLRVSWADDNTLKIEADFGTQTRLLRFASTGELPPPSPQGHSAASWISMGGGGGQEGFQRGGALRVVTTRLSPGYYWKNGMPYSGSAVLKENFFLMDLPNGERWLTLTQQVDDRDYLTEPYVVNYHFKKLSDGSTWHPTPCVVR
jgi:hypothetical protein